MNITRRQFADEERRIARLRRQNWTPDNIKRWLYGWRLVGARIHSQASIRDPG